MPKEKKVVSLAEHKAKSMFKDINNLKELQNAESLTGEALDEGIRVAVEDGSVNLFSLAKTVMSQAEVLDELEYKIALLSAYIVMDDKDKELEKKNLELFMEDQAKENGEI